MLLAAWEAGDLPEPQQRGSRSSSASLVSSPQILQVLVAIAFRRRRACSLERALALAKRPPEETIFDLMNFQDLPSEYKSLAVWDRVLRSGWIHPVPASAPSRTRASRGAGWTSMIERGLTAAADDSADSSSAQLASFLRALRDHKVVPTLELLYRLVEQGAIRADRMAAFCDVFSPRRLKPPPPLPAQHSSPNGLLRAAALSPLPQQDKCTLLEVLLRQGLDPNWVPKGNVPARHSDFRIDVDGWYQNRDETETALHVAVARGEVDVVQLLLRNKAKTDIKDGQDRVALDRLNTGDSSAKEIRDALQTVRGKTGWFGSW